MGTKTLVSLTVQQFKALVGAKKLVFATLSPPSPPPPPSPATSDQPEQCEDIVQKALTLSGIELRQEKSPNDDWDCLVKGEAPEGCSISSWMRELWGEEKQKRRRKPSKLATAAKKKRRTSSNTPSDQKPEPEAVTAAPAAEADIDRKIKALDCCWY